MEGPFIFILFAVIAIVAIVVGHLTAAKRRAELAEVARRLGLEFAPYPDEAHSSYLGFDPFGRGRSNKSSNLLHGRRGEIEFEVFDYKFRTGSGKNSKTHHHGIVAAKVPLHFRHLVLRPESIFDKVAAMVGYDDINFESEQFSRRYHVTCEVRQFAYDLIHPQMIEYLLAGPARHWQLRGDTIVVQKSGRFSSEEIAQVVTMIEGFVSRIPPYVRQDIGYILPVSRAG